MTPKQLIAEAERTHGQTIASILRSMHAAGMKRHEAARRLGMTASQLACWISRNESINPWRESSEPHLVYLRETGETILAAARRLADTHTEHAAALAIGYSQGRALRDALRRHYGAKVEFFQREQYTMDGITATLKEHAKRLGIHYAALKRRIQRWGDLDRAASEPVHRGGKLIAAAERKYGRPFAEILSACHADGLTRKNAAWLLGYESQNQYQAFCQWLARHPDSNPWRDEVTAHKRPDTPFNRFEDVKGIRQSARH